MSHLSTILADTASELNNAAASNVEGDGHRDPSTAAIIRERLKTAGDSVLVNVNNLQEWVTISDPSGIHDDVFMQGHSAEAFAGEVETHYSKLPESADLSHHDCEVYVALSYAENLWA